MEARQKEAAIRNAVTVNAVNVAVDGETQKFLDTREDFTMNVDFECDRPVPANQLFIDVFDGRNVPVLSMPFGFEDDKISAGKHTAEFAVKNVLAFGDFRICIALQTDSERLQLAENACRFHIKGSAAEVMSVVNPDNTVQVTID